MYIGNTHFEFETRLSFQCGQLRRRTRGPKRLESEGTISLSSIVEPYLYERSWNWPRTSFPSFPGRCSRAEAHAMPAPWSRWRRRSLHDIRRLQSSGSIYTNRHGYLCVRAHSIVKCIKKYGQDAICLFREQLNFLRSRPGITGMSGFKVVFAVEPTIVAARRGNNLKAKKKTKTFCFEQRTRLLQLLIGYY